MLKKLMAVLLSLTILTGLVTVPAYAIAADGYYQTFSGLNDDLSVQVQYPDGSYIIGGNASWVDGVGGKEVDDRSLKLVGSDANYFRQDFVMKDNVVIEFSVMFPGPSNATSELKSFRFGPDGYIMNNEKLHKSGAYSANRWDAKVVDVNKWTRFVYEFNCAAGTYNLYLNGVLFKETAPIPSSITNGSTKAFRFMSYNANDEYPIYLDDIKYYSGTYDASNTVASLTSVASNVSVNEEDKKITIVGDIDVEAVSNSLEASSGANIIGVMNPNTFMTRTTGNIEDGDVIAVCAADGVTYTYYTVAVYATKTFNQDFSTIPDMETAGNADLTNYGGGSLANVYTVKGVSGKASDDRSVVTTVAETSASTASYFKKNHILYGRNTISYNVWFPSRTQYANAMYMADQKILYIRPDDNSSRYGIMVGWDVNHDFEVGKWYNIAIDMNLSAEDVDGMTARTYDIYVNGVKYYSSIAVPAAIVDGANIDFRFGSVIGGHIDDIQIVSGGYDATKATVTIASVAGGSVNETVKTIAVTGMNVSDVATAIVPSEGATVLGVVDSASFTAKTEGEVADGDLVVVLAADGVTYNYYKIGIVATEDFSQDFSSAPDKDTAGNADLTNYGGGSLVNAYTAKGVAGKSADDRSIVTTVSEASAASASYFRKNHTLYGRNTISYNLYFPNRGAYINAMYIANQKMLYIRPDDNSSRYGIMVGWDVNHDTEIGKWYNIAIDMNLSTAESDGMAGRTYDIYVNGVRYYSSIAVPAAIKEGVSMEFRFGGSKDGYIDDIQIVGGGYTPAEAAVLTGASGVGVDNENNTLTFSNASVADLTSLVSSQNASVEGVLDVETHMTKTSGNIEVGDLVAVRLADNTYVYYEVVSGATVVSAGDYTFDNNAKTITNVYYNTSVEAFKNAVVLADNTIEKVVKDGDKEVTTGTVKNGMTLNVGENVYTITLKKAFVDDNFEGLTGTRISDYVNGTQTAGAQANIAGITANRNGLGFDKETGIGSFYEIIADGDNEIMMFYTNNTKDHPFFGKNLASGTTSANVVEFSIKKADKNVATKLHFYGPSESYYKTDDEVDSEASSDGAESVEKLKPWENYITPLAFETDGMVYYNGEELFNYKLNEWYRVVIVTDIPNKKMALYINGIKYSEEESDDPIVNMFDIRFEQGMSSKESIVYFDDVQWYELDANVDFYDEEKTAALTAKSSNVTIETGVVFGTIDTTLATVGAILNEVEPTGTMKAYDASGVEIVDTTVAPAHGMYIEVTSLDGLAKAKYTYVVDSISDIFFDVEGNETINGTISAKIHVVNSDEENKDIGKLFIAKYEGNKLVGVNFAKVDARCTAGSYVDRVFSASIDVADSTKESVKAFYFGANGVKPLKGDKELSVSSTNF